VSSIIICFGAAVSTCKASLQPQQRNACRPRRRRRLPASTTKRSLVVFRLTFLVFVLLIIVLKNKMIFFWAVVSTCKDPFADNDFRPSSRSPAGLGGPGRQDEAAWFCLGCFFIILF
jgi:hypothetical protein